MRNEQFIDYITFEKRYSSHTLLAYNTDLNEFKDYLKFQYTIDDLAQAGHEQIRSWLMMLYEQKISARSINRKISSLKSFYRYCLRQGSITVNPMIKVVAPKSPKLLPIFLTKDNLDDLINKIDFGSGYKASRDKLMLMLFYATGMRCSELTQLGIPDIDFSNLTIKVLGKRNKERIIPFGPSLNNVLNDYLVIRIAFLSEQNILTNMQKPALFLTSKGLPCYSKLTYNIVHKYLSLVASNHKLSPHVLRHTFATHMLDDGAHLNAIKEILGHSSLAATQVYTHNTITKLKSIYKQAHPRA